MAERKTEGKTGHSSDQWFKLKTKTPKTMTRNIKRQNQEATEDRKERWKETQWADLKFEDKQQQNNDRKSNGNNQSGGKEDELSLRW